MVDLGASCARALDWPLDCPTRIAASVTIARAAPDAGSVRFSVNIPKAATSPAVLCANLWIENDPVTRVIELALELAEVADAAGVASVPVIGTISLPGVA